jgi:hypothetical protein
MPFASKARKPLVLLSVGLAMSAGLALSPFGLAAANATNATSASSVIKSINTYRTTNSSNTALLQNKFLASYAQDEANYAAKHSTVHVSLTKTTLPFPVNPSEPNPEIGVDGTAKVPHGSVSSVVKFLKTQIADEFVESDLNYVAVGYAKHGSTVYASIVIVGYPAGQFPYDLITESHPTISGTAKVGATLTAVAHFTPAADSSSLTYAWTDGGTIVGHNSTYVVQADDLGFPLKVTVTGSKAGYVGADDETATLTSTSSATKKVVKGTITTHAVIVTGDRNVNATLNADASGWAPEGVELTYKWLRDGKAITGATSSVYQQQAADKGHKIDVKVTGTLEGYTTATKTTATKTKTAAAPLG